MLLPTQTTGENPPVRISRRIGFEITDEISGRYCHRMVVGAGFIGSRGQELERWKLECRRILEGWHGIVQ